MSPQPSNSKASTPAVGFSLVEVTIALAIAALAITVILGLVPAGLTSMREAANTTAETSIMRQLMSEVQSADWGSSQGGTPGWTKLLRYADQRRYFDDQGTLLSGGADSMLSYVARIRFPSSSVVLPGGASAGSGTSSDMVYLTVDVAATPDPNFSFTNPSAYQSRTWILARQY